MLNISNIEVDLFKILAATTSKYFQQSYMDGNGRLGRFLMNTMFALVGYPWTTVQVERRKEYLDSLEKASVDNDIKPFVKLILSSMNSHNKG